MSLNPPIKKMSLQSVNQTGFYFTLSLMLSSNVREDPREDLADTVLIVCVHSLSESVSYFIYFYRASNGTCDPNRMHCNPVLTLTFYMFSGFSQRSEQYSLAKWFSLSHSENRIPSHTFVFCVFFSFMVSWFIKQASADTSNSHRCIETDTTIKAKYLLVSKHLSLRCNIYWL